MLAAVKQKYGFCVKCVTALVIAAFLSSSAAQAAPNRYESSHLAPESRTIGDRHEDEREAYKLLYEKIEVSRGKKRGPADETTAARTALNFLKQNGLRMLVLTGLVAGIHLAAAAPALGFDGQSVMGVFSTVGMIIGNILVFSIIFTVVASFFPGGGALFALGLNVVLNVAFYYGYRWYAEYKQRQFEMAQRLTAPKIKAPLPVKPALPPTLPKPAVDRKLTEAVTPVVPGGAKIINLAEYRKKKEQAAEEGKKQGQKQLVISEREAVELSARAAEREETLGQEGNAHVQGPVSRMIQPKKPGVVGKMIIGQAPEEPSLVQRMVGTLKNMTNIFGMFWLVSIVGILLNATPLNAVEVAGAPGTPTSSSVTGIIVVTLFTLTAAAYGFWKYFRPAVTEDEAALKKAGQAKPTPGAATQKPISPEARQFAEFFQNMLLDDLHTLAVFNKQVTLDGNGTFDLAFEYKKKNFAFMEKTLAEKGMTVREFTDKVQKLAQMIRKEPNGNAIQKIMIMNEPEHIILFKKYLNVMMVFFPLLDKEELLEMLFVPHEVYHAGIDGDIGIEEVLVHALSYVRVYNTYKDPKKKSFFAKAMSQLAEIESKREAQGRLTQGATIRNIIDYIGRHEKARGKPLSGEEKLQIALPHALKYIRENKDLFNTGLISVDKDLASLKDAEVARRALAMWNAHQAGLLKGQLLYVNLLPLALLDFSSLVTPGFLKELLVYGTLFAAILLLGKRGTNVLTAALQHLRGVAKVLTGLHTAPKELPFGAARPPGRFAETFRQLSDMVGPKWPLIFTMSLLNVSVLDASPVSEYGSAVVNRDISNYEMAAYLLPIAIFAVGLLYALSKKGGKLSPEDRAERQRRRSGMRWQEDLLRDPDAATKIEMILKCYLIVAKPVAIFDREIAPDGAMRYVLSKDFAPGKNAQAERLLREHGRDMDYVAAKIEKIAKFIAHEPNGKAVQRIIIIANDSYHIQLRKVINNLIIVLPFLEYEAMLEAFSIPHEVYHTVVEGNIAIEETLVHALSFVRMYSIYKEGKTDKDRKALYEKAMAELHEFEEERRAAGRTTQEETIRALLAAVAKMERYTGRDISTEEVLMLALQLTVKYLRGNVDVLGVSYIDDYMAQMTDEQMIFRAKEMWLNQQPKLLRGQPLYIVLLPLALTDFSNYIPHSIELQIMIQAMIFGSLITNGELRKALGSMFDQIKSFNEIPFELQPQPISSTSGSIDLQIERRPEFAESA